MTPLKKTATELVTDLYEFSMAASYLQEGMDGEATFSLFIRDYPPHRAYFVSAGIEQLLQTITTLHFSEGSIAYLASLNKFSSTFLDYLRGFRFTGSVRAIPEGRIFFSHEPLLEVTAPLIQAQLLETLAINALQLQVLIASKAARCVQAGSGKGLIDFSLRRTHGIDAGLKVARASYLVGFLGTSNVLAGKIYGLPVYGTMAHSFVTSFDREVDSFEAFARAFPEETVLLIDTYDTLQGARKAVQIARRLEGQGQRLQGVRLDSGDLADLSIRVRRLLDEAGLSYVKILVSGNLDEFKIEELLKAGSAIDSFAVGTRLGVSADAPYLDMVYKLVEYRGKPVLKLSSGKKTWVGKKQVYRRYDSEGYMQEDILGLIGEEGHFETQGLLETRVENGCIKRPVESLETLRHRFQSEWQSLPVAYRSIRPQATYPVRISAPLRELDERVSALRRREEIDAGGVS